MITYQKKTDWSGNKYIQFYFNKTVRIGYSQAEMNASGSYTIKHYDQKGNLKFRSSFKQDWYESDFAEFHKPDFSKDRSEKSVQKEKKKDYNKIDLSVQNTSPNKIANILLYSKRNKSTFTSDNNKLKTYLNNALLQSCKKFGSKISRSYKSMLLNLGNAYSNFRKISLYIIGVVFLISIVFIVLNSISKKSNGLKLENTVNNEILRPGKITDGVYVPQSELTVSASSNLSSSKNSTFLPQNLFDRKKSTAWVEGVPGHGIDEQILIQLNKKRSVFGIKILNGYNLDVKDSIGDRWPLNSRVKQMHMKLTENETKIIQLTDDKSFQNFSFEPVETDKIVLAIKDVYFGSRWEDTALSEIAIYAKN